MKSLLVKNRMIFVLLLSGIVLRLAAIGVGYHGDLNNNISWAQLSYERGLSGFYESGDWPYSAPNQPPLTILLFYTVSFIWNYLNDFFWWLNNSISLFPSGFIWIWEKWGMITLIKLPSIIADIAIAGVIYRHIKEISTGDKKINPSALLLTSLWILNPITWYNSSIWGQTDPIVNLLGLIAILSFFNKNIIGFSLFFTMSVLFKGSLLIFAPLLAVLLIYKQKSILEVVRAVFVSFFCIVIISIWFHPSIDFVGWLFNLYKERILPGEIGYLTANAFNIWWLVNSGKVLDSQKYFLLSFRTWGFVIFAGFYVLLSYKALRDKSDKIILFALILITFTSFMFMTRMHERYLYPFFPLATILLYYIPRMWPLYLMVSITFLLNMFNLFWIPQLPLIRSIMENPLAPRVISVLNLIILGGFLLMFFVAKNLSSKQFNKS